MALYAPKSQNNQPQMYGVPGGMYITLQQRQQQPNPNQHPAMFNRMGAVPPQGIPMGMGAPRQPGFMQQQQQQASSLASFEFLNVWQNGPELITHMLTIRMKALQAVLEHVVLFVML